MGRLVVAALTVLIGVVAVFLTVAPADSMLIRSSSSINCTNYNASIPCVFPDLNVYCLSNGSTVRGFCNAQQAVCKDNVPEATNITTCSSGNTPTANPNNNNNNNNTASRPTAAYITASLSVAVAVHVILLP